MLAIKHTGSECLGSLKLKVGTSGGATVVVAGACVVVVVVVDGVVVVVVGAVVVVVGTVVVVVGANVVVVVVSAVVSSHRAGMTQSEQINSANRENFIFVA